MTLIAGFKCLGGIALCADTLEETQHIKCYAEKLITYDREWCQVGFAGSGENGDLIDGVVDKVQGFLDDNKPETLSDIKRVIGDALISVYQNEMAAYPQPSGDPVDIRVVLLMAVHGKKDSQAILLTSYGTLLHESHRYDIRGIGEIVRFGAKRLYRDDMSLWRGVLLCTHLLGTLQNECDCRWGR